MPDKKSDLDDFKFIKDRMEELRREKESNSGFRPTGGDSATKDESVIEYPDPSDVGGYIDPYDHFCEYYGGI